MASDLGFGKVVNDVDDAGLDGTLVKAHFLTWYNSSWLRKELGTDMCPYTNLSLYTHILPLCQLSAAKRNGTPVAISMPKAQILIFNAIV